MRVKNLKNRIKERLSANTNRVWFSEKEMFEEIPNLIEIQKKSFTWFIEEGLDEILEDISPIADFSGNLLLEFIKYRFEKKSKYEIEESKERDATYAFPLKVKARLINKNTGEVKEQEVFMGEMPIMTPSGTFIINGIERVIVSQLVRSPGIYYSQRFDKTGKKLFSCQVIPNRGTWLEYETDSNDVFYIKIDRNKKIPATVLIRALGFDTDESIEALFGKDEIITATLSKDTCKDTEDALREIHRKLRPGEPFTVENAKQVLHGMFFEPKRYDLSRVGRYKFNKKLGIKDRITNKIAYETISNEYTGEIFTNQNEVITPEMALQIENSGINVVYIKVENDPVKVISNGMVDASYYIEKEIVESLEIKEKVNFVVLKRILQNHKDKNTEEFKNEILQNKNELIPKTITVDDIIASISYALNLNRESGSVDDIDHLANRRVRCVGELLQNQFRAAFLRLERVIKERMNVQDLDSATPQSLVNIRSIISVIREFFGTSQLSQFMEQINLLSELTHKRRLSALGSGGLSRDRAGYEVRDVHHSHYGRVCPIETPEGPNIGLINSLSLCARINEHGFVEAPYRKVDKETGQVTDEIVYMTADVEYGYFIAQATEPLDENKRFLNDIVIIRNNENFEEVPKNKVDYVDWSPVIVSVATSLIPFLENDDGSRALMGSNMQRQAVPLIQAVSPLVGTGIENKVAKDSGVMIIARKNGKVIKASAQEIITKDDSGNFEKYEVRKFGCSNQGTCLNQNPIVNVGDEVKAGDVLADGPSTRDGEVALGRDVLIAFMTWEGYNYEDAILLSEKLIKDDVFTSIHIERYEIDARTTKLGPEVITADIPGISEDAIKDLDENGIIRIGAEVKSGEILVGKVTPKGETELTAEERLLRAIFGEKAREARDTSLRVPHGEGGIVTKVHIFTRENGDELQPGVNKLVRVYIAQKRKISIGDKMAGRHGNKGVVSRILPEEDMPFLEDGTPVDMILNPLGVPPRMNIGQIFETHLGYAAKKLGFKVATPVFDGAHREDIMDCLEEAGCDRDGKSVLYDGRTGQAFDNRVTVGYMHILKLAHLVDDKIHARSTGPYSLVTQQPLGGKAQFGGQRFGEMEVWALYAYGSAYTLQEILTVKSDDVTGRVKTYEAIVKGENIPNPGIPESFKVLIKEFQSLCLDVKILNKDKKEILLDAENKKPINASEMDKNNLAKKLSIIHEESDEDDEIEEIAQDEDEDEDEDLDENDQNQIDNNLLSDIIPDLESIDLDMEIIDDDDEGCVKTN